MKIGVVGTFIRDRIFPFHGEAVESIGGIFFTVSYLANLLDPYSEIYPISFVGENFYDVLIEQLSIYPNVCLDGIVKTNNKHTQVKLIYTGPQERYEITTEPMPPLHSQELSILKDTDAVLVNLITGSDVDLSALREFRQYSNSLIYLDFHSHALGINEEGKRFYRCPKDWRDWINEVDILQLNEQEAQTLAGTNSDKANKSILEFGEEVLNMRPMICHITLAEKGSYLFYQNQTKKQVQKFNAVPVSNVVDIIGCGDAFATGFMVNYLSSRNVLTATHFANEVAAMNCTFMGSSGVKKIKSLMNQREVFAY